VVCCGGVVRGGDGWNDAPDGESGGKSIRSLLPGARENAGACPGPVDARPEPGAEPCDEPWGVGPIEPAARALVGASTARVTIEARLGPPAAGRGVDVAGRGGNAAGMPELEELEDDEDEACACCSARTLGGGWKLGVGRGRTLLGRYILCCSCGGINAVWSPGSPNGAAPPGPAGGPEPEKEAGKNGAAAGFGPVLPRPVRFESVFACHAGDGGAPGAPPDGKNV
jgi:hypothetical protein